MTFAVIQTGGKQYKVAEGDVVSIEKLPEVEVGKKVTFDDVLMIDDGKKSEIGTPYISGKKVTGEVVEMGRGKKIRIIKFKSKSNYMKRQGHRQDYVKVRIEKIV